MKKLILISLLGLILSSCDMPSDSIGGSFIVKSKTYSKGVKYKYWYTIQDEDLMILYGIATDSIYDIGDTLKITKL